MTECGGCCKVSHDKYSHIMQTEFLDAGAIQLKRCHGALAMVADATKTPLAPPRRALPLSNPDEYIVLSDSDGNEIGWLRRVDELDKASRAALEQTLAEIYVVTRIARVREVEKEAISGHIRWRVEVEPEASFEESAGDDENGEATAPPNSLNGDGSQDPDAPPHDAVPNMGARILKKLSRDDEGQTSEEREFFIAGTEDVQTARYPQIFIVDTERNRYEITNCETLDVESRRAAERYF